jgi:hypothetical protein
MEGQRAQGGEATSARPADHQPPPIHLAGLNQGAGRVQAIGDVKQAPLAGQALAVGAAVAGRAGVVDLHHPEPSAGEELGAQVQAGLGVGGRPRMGLHQQRRPHIRRSGDLRVGGWVIEPMSRLAIPGRKLHRLGQRDPGRVKGDLSPRQNLDPASWQVQGRHGRAGRWTGADER